MIMISEENGHRIGPLTSVENMDSNFVCMWREDFNVFDFQIFASSPTHRSLAFYDDPSCRRHCECGRDKLRLGTRGCCLVRVDTK